MGRKKVNTGDILQIPLWGNLGYAYARYIDLTIYPAINLPSMIKVYEYWTKTDAFNTEKFKHSNYLVQPILVAGIYPTLHKKLWTIVDKNVLADDDGFIPHFRDFEPRFLEEKDARKWCYIKDCELDNRTFTDLDNIKHLERWGACGTGNIEIRLTIQVIKKEGLKLEDYLDLEDETVQYQLKMAEESPLLSEMPESMHGRAIS